MITNHITTTELEAISSVCLMAVWGLSCSCPGVCVCVCFHSSYTQAYDYSGQRNVEVSSEELATLEALEASMDYDM